MSRFITEEELKQAILTERQAKEDGPITISRSFNPGTATTEQIAAIKSRKYRFGPKIDTTGWDLDDSGKLIQTDI